MENDQLMHFGILGMKWGVRRYQNKDGNLTEEGKLRYGTTSNDSSSKGNSFGLEENKKALGSLKKETKSAHQMDDDELLKHVARLKLEKEYSELVAEQKKNGTGRVEKLLKNAGEEFLKQSLSKIVSRSASRLFDKHDKNFKIGNYGDKDLTKLDMQTLKQITAWYESARAAEKAKNSYEHRNDPSVEKKKKR